MYGIFTYIYHKIQLNVGKYTIPMGPMGNHPLPNKFKVLQEKQHVTFVPLGLINLTPRGRPADKNQKLCNALCAAFLALFLLSGSQVSEKKPGWLGYIGNIRPLLYRGYYRLFKK